MHAFIWRNWSRLTDVAELGKNPDLKPVVDAEVIEPSIFIFMISLQGTCWLYLKKAGGMQPVTSTEGGCTSKDSLRNKS